MIGKMLGLQVHVRHCFIRILANSYTYSLITCDYSQPRSFGFAGTKDKRAITTQQVLYFNLCCGTHTTYQPLAFLPLLLLAMWVVIQYNKYGLKMEVCFFLEKDDSIRTNECYRSRRHKQDTYFHFFLDS